VQGTILHRKLMQKNTGQAAVFVPEVTRKRWPCVRQLIAMFGSLVTIVVEAWTCYRPGHRWHEGDGEKDDMIIMRGVLWSQDGGDETQDRDKL
jgi:hypothetical protein